MEDQEGRSRREGATGAGGFKERPKRTQNRLFKYLYTYVGPLRLGYGGCDITSEMSSSTETEKETHRREPC